MSADEEGTVRLWTSFVSVVRERLTVEHGGKIVKSLGDGLLMSFGSTTDAVRCAFSMVDPTHEAEGTAKTEPRLRLRIAVHPADVMVDSIDVYGAGVNLASRLCSLAEPGQIVISAEARDELMDGVGDRFEDMGERFVKHVDVPIRSYRSLRSGVSGVDWEVPAPLEAEARPTVAVLPFIPSVADDNLAYACDVLLDDVVFGLSVAETLNVISTLSTVSFSTRDLSLGAIGAALRADYVVRGRVSRIGHRLAIRTELADVASGRVRWQGRFQCEPASLLEPEAEAVAGIVDGISSGIMDGELDRVRRQALSSLRSGSLLFAAARLMHRSSRVDVRQSRDILEHLVEREPRSARPHAWLSNWHALSVTQSLAVDRPQGVQRAVDHASRAIERDPDCALALAIDGIIRVNLKRDMAGGRRSLQRAVQANPNEGIAWLYKGVVHGFAGEGPDALEASGRALRLSPLDPMRHYYESLAATAALGARDYQRAVALARSSIRANRLHPSTFRALTIGLSMMGSASEASESARQLLELIPAYTVAEFERSSGFSVGPMASAFAGALADAGIPRT